MPPAPLGDRSPRRQLCRRAGRLRYRGTRCAGAAARVTRCRCGGLGGRAALSLTPAMIISVTLTHWIVTQFVPPRVLPKLDVERGLGAAATRCW
jgi:hypothetical protein